MNARGWCPSVAVPMPTGDGLLARLIVHEPVPLTKLTALCVAADEFGNGIVEVTQRGNLQIRGLTEASAPRFARAVESLRLGAQVGPPLVTSPLLGLDAYEPFDSTTLVPALLQAFKGAGAYLQSLSPKVSVLVDGGGNLHLDALNADIRLVAAHDQVFRLSLAGNGSDATYLAHVGLEQAPAEVVRVLGMLADRGPAARARDLLPDDRDALERVAAEPTARPTGAEPTVRPEDAEPIVRPASAESTVRKAADLQPAVRPGADPVGIHVLKDGHRALGVALPFGHMTATALRRFIQAAADHGTSAMRPAPGRALMVIGLSQSAAEKLRAIAARDEGLVVDAHDARRHVVACTGAPACASAQLSTRELAPEVARVTQAWAGTSKVVHLAGCTKGCAHPRPATLTVVGPDRIVVNGRASDPPSARAITRDSNGADIGAAGLLDAIERLCHEI